MTSLDGSGLRLTVYVAIKDTAARDSKTNKSDVKGSSSILVSSSDASKQSSSSEEDVEKPTAKVSTNKSSGEKTNRDVVVEDPGSTTVTEKNVSVVNNSKDSRRNSKRTSNPVSVATQLPETEGRAVDPLVVIGGLLVAAISTVAIFGEKIRNKL